MRLRWPPVRLLRCLQCSRPLVAARAVAALALLAFALAGCGEVLTGPGVPDAGAQDTGDGGNDAR